MADENQVDTGAEVVEETPAADAPAVEVPAEETLAADGEATA